MLPRFELVLQAIEVDLFRAIFGLPPVQRETEGLEAGLCLLVFSRQVKLLRRLSLLSSLEGLHAQSFLMLLASL